MTIDTRNPADLVPSALTPEQIEAGTAIRRTGVLRTPEPERPVVDNSLRARAKRSFVSVFGAVGVVSELIDRIEALEAEVDELNAGGHG